MARLRSLTSRLRTAEPRIKAPGFSSADRRMVQPWRAWYDLKRWKKLRALVLKRDGWTCQQTGQLLTGKEPAPNSPVVDHIVPHRGDPALFWDIDNLQTVSKAWHDSEKQRRERRGLV